MQPCGAIRFWSSKNWSNTEYFWSGILSFNGGGFFYNWIKVLIPSCDGGAFLGNSDPISDKRDKIYFRIPKRQGTLRLPRPILETPVKRGNSGGGFLQLSNCGHDVDLASPIAHLSAGKNHRRRSHFPEHPQPQAQLDGSSAKV